MTTRRALRGVANDLAASFVGRSNDLDGYWSVGLLRSFADDKAIRELSFDLLSGGVMPEGEVTRRVANAYAAWLVRHLAKLRLPIERLSRAELLLRFDAYDGPAPPPQITRGEPFMCTVLLVDDHGRRYERTLSSWCGTHDPAREWRRAPERYGLTG